MAIPRSPFSLRSLAAIECGESREGRLVATEDGGEGALKICIVERVVDRLHHDLPADQREADLRTRGQIHRLGDLAWEQNGQTSTHSRHLAVYAHAGQYSARQRPVK